MEQLKIDDTYTILKDIHGDKPFLFHCLRYGEEWRSLVGDNLILAMVNRIEDLEEENKELRSVWSQYQDNFVTENT